MALGLVAVLGAACSSGSAKTTASPISTSIPTTHPNAPTTPTSTRPRGKLEFRKVDYTDTSPPPVLSATSPSCLLIRHHSSTATKEAVLFDRNGHCYLVGPALLTGAGIDSAGVVYDSTTSTWAVNLHWGNNDFLRKMRYRQKLWVGLVRDHAAAS